MTISGYDCWKRRRNNVWHWNMALLITVNEKLIGIIRNVKNSQRRDVSVVGDVQEVHGGKWKGFVEERSFESGVKE